MRAGPVVALDYAKAKVDGYTETGDAALTLDVSSVKAKSFTGGLGLELRGDVPCGLFEAADLASFRVYGERTAGGGIDYSAPLEEITAFPGGVIQDGFGMGGFGEGGFGCVAAFSSWTSAPLGGGTWAFAVVPVDSAGNEGVRTTTSRSILAPPGPPGLNPAGLRLTRAYAPSTYQITLNWLPSPG